MIERASIMTERFLNQQYSPSYCELNVFFFSVHTLTTLWLLPHEIVIISIEFIIKTRFWWRILNYADKNISIKMYLRKVNWNIICFTVIHLFMETGSYIYSFWVIRPPIKNMVTLNFLAYYKISVNWVHIYLSISYTYPACNNIIPYK